MKKLIVAGLLGTMAVLGAGCTLPGMNSAGSGDVIEDSISAPDIVTDDEPQREIEPEIIEDGDDEQDADNGRITADSSGTGSQAADPADVNHGHSITERTEPDFNEMLRSDEVLYDGDEAYDFLMDNIVYPEREPYTFQLTGSSMNDPGAYLWYDFTPFYNNIPVVGAEFRVITFNDGTILEGYEGFFRIVPDDLSNIKTHDEILEIYNKQSNDARDYRFFDEYYLYKKGDNSCPYVYVYRYDCGDVLRNTTLTLDAETGERLGFMPDAID